MLTIVAENSVASSALKSLLPDSDGLLVQYIIGYALYAESHQRHEPSVSCPAVTV